MTSSQQVSFNLGPLTVSQIMDRALRLLPKLFSSSWQLFILLSAITALQLSLQLQGDELTQASASSSLELVLQIISILLSIVFYFALILLGADIWLDRPAHLTVLRQRLRIGLVLRTGVLLFWMTLITFCGLLLLIIPGLLYATNRFLAPYVLVMKDVSIETALRQSKYLMTRGSWYSLRGPYMRLGAIVSVTVIVGVLAGILALLVGLSSSFGWLDNAYQPLLAFGVALTQYLVQAFGVLAYLGFYYDLSVRYEAKDILPGAGPA